MKQFESMEASRLFCPKCQVATEVRKRLLLVLSEGDKFDYVCSRCGTVCGDKIERGPVGGVAGGMALPPSRVR